MDNQKIILNVENLNTTFVSDKKEIKIVKNVSFQVKRGKTLAVVGESGCGKSVTMNSIMRFTGKNAIVKADSIQYNALHDGKVTEYHLESITKPNGPEMRALRGPDLSMVFQDPMSSLTHVMCNQDNGLSFIYLKGFEQFHNLCLNGYIQCSCRFIADDQFRITDHGNGNYHTLLHATGELMRIAVNTLFRVRDSQFAEHFQNFFSCFCFFHSFVML